MNQDSNGHNHLDELDEPLRQAVAQMCLEQLSEPVCDRLLSNARELVSNQSLVSDKGVPFAWRQVAKGILGLVIAATLVLVVIMRPRESQAWDKVLAAIAKRPWLRVVDKVQGRKLGETWYSAESQVIAGHSTPDETGELFIFMDVEKGTIDHYAESTPTPFMRQAGKVFRSAIRKDNRRGIDAAIRRYEAALLGHVNGMLVDAYDVESRDSREVIRDGRSIVEYRFQLKVAEQHAREVVIAVDKQTDLPVEKRVRMKDRSPNNQTTEIVSTLSFPDSGPRSIFDLGVPRDVELIDIRPSKSTQVILDALREGRTKMDRYSAVVTDGSSREPSPRNATVHMVWKDGTRWRIEQLRKLLRGQVPAPDSAKTVSWWHEFAAGADTAVEVVSDGHVECTYSRDRSNGDRPDPLNPDYLLIESYVEKIRPHRDPTDPDAYSDEFLAEWIGFPKFVYDATFAVDPEPADGPLGTFLFTMTYTDRSERVWLDPARGHLALRHDWLKRDGQTFGRLEVLDSIQTPSGKWLPKVVKATVPLPNGGEQVRYRNFFFKFDVESEPSRFVIRDL